MTHPGDKKVLLPVDVPKGDLCWDFKTQDAKICDYFDNEGGYSRCLLFNPGYPTGLEYDGNPYSKNQCKGVKKLDKCLELKEAPE